MPQDCISWRVESDKVGEVKRDLEADEANVAAAAIGHRTILNRLEDSGIGGDGSIVDDIAVGIVKGHQFELGEVDPMAAEVLEPIFDVAVDCCGAAELAAKSVEHGTCVDRRGSKGTDINLIGVGAFMNGPRSLDHGIQLDVEAADRDGDQLLRDEAHLGNR